jgi:hypothetical protein
MGSLQQTDEIDDGPKEFRHQRKAEEAAFFLHPSVGRDINHVVQVVNKNKVLKLKTTTKPPLSKNVYQRI